MRVSDKQREQLTELGFVWDLPEHRWMKKFNLLQEYKREHGHTLVPPRLPQSEIGKYAGTSSASSSSSAAFSLRLCVCEQSSCWEG
jgi:hypothetical protein